MNLQSLAALVRRERESVLSRWREQVRQLPSARHLDVPTLNDHIVGVLDELASAFALDDDHSIPDALNEWSPQAHGLQRLKEAFDIEEVVAEYNILRGCIHDLAGDNGVNLQGKPFHILNRVFDQAIGQALQTYATQRELEVQRRREEYLAFVAHDLRTPLNAIALAARVLELSLPDQAATTPQASHMFNALRRSVQQLESLVEKVLEENTNLETELGVKLERRDIDLWPLVEGITHNLYPIAATNRTRLINDVPDDLVVYADAGLLRRILQNLIANAIKYTPGGAVTIGARGLGEGGGVECWVSDTGAGIAAGMLEKVFEKGETDPEVDGGIGLGLAVVKTFTEAHGGTVSVHSQEGVGSTFRLALPNRANVVAQSPPGT
ncbi:MAG: HAMP domain-containing sensor histidine kinase [Gemmatimonadaceae bacterium]|nr:HAMP domain-containing sensor histidine kinase [Gemmatimonadaceae bacterium]